MAKHLFFVARNEAEVEKNPLSACWHGGVLVIAGNPSEALALAQRYDEVSFQGYNESWVWYVPIGVKGVIYDDRER